MKRTANLCESEAQKDKLKYKNLTPPNPANESEKITELTDEDLKIIEEKLNDTLAFEQMISQKKDRVQKVPDAENTPQPEESGMNTDVTDEDLLKIESKLLTLEKPKGGINAQDKGEIECLLQDLNEETTDETIEKSLKENDNSKSHQESTVDIDDINMDELEEYCLDSEEDAAPQKDAQDTLSAQDLAIEKELDKKRDELKNEIALVNEIFLIMEIEVKEEAETHVIIKPLNHLHLPLKFTLILRQSWRTSPFQVDDEIRVIGRMTSLNNFQLIYDDMEYTTDYEGKKGECIILEPKLLVSSTDISTTIPCARVPLMKNMFNNCEGPPKFPLIYGNMVHMVFQKMLELKEFSEVTVHKIIKESIQDQILNLYFIRKEYSEECIYKKISEAAVKIKQWINCMSKTETNMFKIAFKRQIAIEQEIHCDFYGVKGKIDSTILCINDKGQEQINALELKTGRYRSASHRGQVLLYNILLDDIFKGKNKDSLLLYLMLQKHPCEIITKVDIEVRNLLQNRNILVRHLKNRVNSEISLPNLIRTNTDCNKCFSKKQCALYAYSLEEKTCDGETPTFKAYRALEKTMPKSVQEYYKKWITAINQEQLKEEESTHTEKSKLYYENPILSKLLMNSLHPKDDGVVVHLIKRLPDYFTGGKALNKMNERDTVILKPDNSTLSFTKGVILRKRYYIQNSNKVWIERKTFTKGLTQDLKLIIQLSLADLQNFTREALGGISWNETSWKLQKEILTNPKYSNMRGNVFLLCSEKKYEEKRNFIIQNNISELLEIQEQEKSQQIVNKYPSVCKGLDQVQKEALSKSLECKYFHLVNGGPGTGKTTVLLKLLKVLKKEKKKVLLVSHSNSVLDDLLGKVQKEGISFKRIAFSSSQVHPDILGNTITPNSFEEYYDIMEVMEQNLFATNAIGVTNKLIALLKPFEYVIFDGANKICEPEALSSILVAQKFIMFGDYHVEGPETWGEDQLEVNFSMSLFQRLFNQYYSCATILNQQYQGNEQINEFLNKEFYFDSLRIEESLKTENLLYNKDFNYGLIQVDFLQYALYPQPAIAFIGIDNLLTQHPECQPDALNSGILSMILHSFITKDLCSPEKISVISSAPSDSISTLLTSLDITSYATLQDLPAPRNDLLILLISPCDEPQEAKILRKILPLFGKAIKKLIIIGQTGEFRKQEKLDRIMGGLNQKNYVVQIEKLEENWKEYFPVSGIFEEKYEVKEKKEGE
ncbi:unnamed protein product [Moneuplotes crassus]|uniref:DNA helicase n=1 Tax=Euplotes crassus TaxID=5936 RepID=A0AAD1UK86_EUPCR|nr:unnamed protein product [Moneuplotes crassus]